MTDLPPVFVRKENWTGKIKGPYKILGLVEKRYKKPNIWLVECIVCKEQQHKSQHAVTYRPETKYCCLCKNKHMFDKADPSTHPRWKGYKDLSGSYITIAKHGARIRGLSFEVGLEYLYEKLEAQNRKCALTGLDLFLQKNASIDRIDSSKGYIEGNVQWVHKTANELKWDLTEKELLYWCRLVVETLGKTND